MVAWAPDSYWLVRFVFLRGLALVYLLAFLVAATQFRPLAGEDGLRPLGRWRERFSMREKPSLFHYVPTDRAIAVAAWSGVGLSVLALVGAPAWVPRDLVLPASMALWATLWVLYQSFVNAGGIFYGYGWESMLLETGFLAIFLGAGPFATPVVVVWLLRWVLFRNMFGAGLIKLRGDDCWRELTCLDYHYETQPMPNPLSWAAHHLPDRFHRLETLGNHVMELVVPFLYFAPQPVASIAGGATIGFQGWLVLTGNFSWLNALTIVLAVSTFSDGVLAALSPFALPDTVGGVAASVGGAASDVGGAAAAVGGLFGWLGDAASRTVVAVPLPTWFLALTLLLALLVLVLSYWPVRNLLSTRQRMNTSFDPLHLVNTYGAFGSITTERHQVVIEGTDEPAPDEDDWDPYVTKGQPVALDERPPQWAPYHLRLDWQLWFAAMSRSPRRHRWFGPLLQKLLEGDDAVESLFREVPVEDPPEYVRARRFRYRFTDPDEHRETGDWWTRELVNTYVGPLSLSDLEGRRGVG